MQILSGWFLCAWHCSECFRFIYSSVSSQQFYYWPHFTDGLPKMTEWISSRARSQPLPVVWMIGPCPSDSFQLGSLPLFRPHCFYVAYFLGATLMMTSGSGEITELKPEASAGKKKTLETLLPPPSSSVLLLLDSLSTRHLHLSARSRTALGRSQRTSLFPPSLTFPPYLSASSSLT